MCMLTSFIKKYIIIQDLEIITYIIIRILQEIIEQVVHVQYNVAYKIIMIRYTFEYIKIIFYGKKIYVAEFHTIEFIERYFGVS